MSGYEKSPDYGGGDGPPAWAMAIAVAVIVGIVAGIAWLGSAA